MTRREFYYGHYRCIALGVERDQCPSCKGNPLHAVRVELPDQGEERTILATDQDLTVWRITDL